MALDFRHKNLRPVPLHLPIVHVPVRQGQGTCGIGGTLAFKLAANRSPAKSYTKFWRLAAYNSLAVILVPLPPQTPEPEGFHSTLLWNYSSHSNPGWRPI